MSICKRCLVSNDHPFGRLLDNNICPACFQNESFLTDFERLFLKNNKAETRYDCVVLLRGTPEDYFVISTLIDKSIYPICVFVNSHMGTDIAWKNVHNLIHRFDLELRVFSPNPSYYKKMVRYSLRRTLDILTPLKVLQFNYAVKIANSLGVKRIISGENQPRNIIGKYSNQSNVEHTVWSLVEHDIHMPLHDYFSPALDMPDRQLQLYRPSYKNAKNISWVFLSDFIEWDQMTQDIQMTKFGAIGQYEDSTFDYWHRAGSSVFYGIHDILRFEKFGSIKSQDHFSREVRAGRLSRHQALNFYEKYLDIALNEIRIKEKLKEFFSWLNMDTTSVDWFFKHRLKRCQSRKPINKISSPVELGTEVLTTIGFEAEALRPEKLFVNFYKGARL